MEILKEEKPENEIDYVDTIELFPTLKWITEPNEIDQFTILKQVKPDNEIDYTNDIQLLGEERPENIVEERDLLTLEAKQKEPLEAEYVDELFIERVHKDRKSTRLNSSHIATSRMPSSA